MTTAPSHPVVTLEQAAVQEYRDMGFWKRMRFQFLAPRTAQYVHHVATKLYVRQ